MSGVHVINSGYVSADSNVSNYKTVIRDYSTWSHVITEGGVAPATISTTAPTTSNLSLSVRVQKRGVAYINTSSALSFGSNHFTIEGWFYAANDGAGRNQVYDNRGTQSLLLGFNNLTPYYYDGASDKDASSAMTATTWTHVAWCRNASGIGIYMRGSRVRAHAAWSAGGATAACGVEFGQFLQPYTFAFQFSQFRVIKGTSLYNDATYTVPTSQLAVTADTVLYLDAQRPGGVRYAGYGSR